MNLTRRQFLVPAAASSGVLATPALLRAEKDKKYRTALIGSGWWGMNILREAIAARHSVVVALCDVDRQFLDGATAEVEKLTGSTPKKYTDYRELLDKEKPDIAIIATPAHWHALQTIAALRAGAHVYVEKPICHTIREGRAMVQAARASGRVVQVGTHRRVSPHNLTGRDFIRSGKLGKIGMMRAFVHYGGGPEKPHRGWQQGAVFYPIDDRKAPLRFPPRLHKPDDQNIQELWEDFLQAIQTPRRPVCDIEDICYSTTARLLGMLSLKLGRSVQWDGAKGIVLNDSEANKGLQRSDRAPWKYPEVS